MTGSFISRFLSNRFNQSYFTLFDVAILKHINSKFEPFEELIKSEIKFLKFSNNEFISAFRQFLNQQRLNKVLPAGKFMLALNLGEKLSSSESK